MTPTIFNALSCGFALTAAAAWLWSASVRFPNLRGRHETILEDLQSRAKAMRQQSRRNAAAAIAAAGAALTQAIALVSSWFFLPG
jgi:hypothetical protein